MVGITQPWGRLGQGRTSVHSPGQAGLNCSLPPFPHTQHMRTHIADGAVMGTRASLLPGSTIEEGGVVGACSLVMKGEHVGAHTFWFGLPAGPVSKRSARWDNRLSMLRTIRSLRFSNAMFSIRSDQSARASARGSLDQPGALKASARRSMQDSITAKGRVRRASNLSMTAKGAPIVPKHISSAYESAPH